MQRLALAGLLVATLVSVGVAAQQVTWKAPRTPWGDPDISGLFTTDDELGVPFERPAQFGDRPVVTEEEYRQRLTQSERQEEADREEFVAPRAGRGEGPGGTGPPAHWLERGKPSRRTSLVIDPPDGRIPFLNEEARRRGAIAAMRTPEGIPFNGPEDLDKYDRCITRGFPHVIFPTIYDNTSQIVQGPGWVSMRYEMIHDARIIPLDNRPHVSSKIRSYFGDSRGRWDGDTLVVDVTNFSQKSGYRGATTNLALRAQCRRSHDILTPLDRVARFEKGSAPGAGARVRVPRGQLRDVQHPERSTGGRTLASTTTEA
jgi:hypothetical protein